MSWCTCFTWKPFSWVSKSCFFSASCGAMWQWGALNSQEWFSTILLPWVACNEPRMIPTIPPPPPSHPHFSLACYGRNTADAEFKVPTTEYPGISKVFPFQPEVGQNIAAHAAPTARSLSSDFCSPRSFGFSFFFFSLFFFFFFFLHWYIYWFVWPSQSFALNGCLKKKKNVSQFFLETPQQQPAGRVRC